MPSTNEAASAVDSREVWNKINAAAVDPVLVEQRLELARFAAETLSSSGSELHVFGHIIGPDRKAGLSPFAHGSDEAVAVSTLLRIAAQLASASAGLFRDGRSFAAAALLRQLVEIEYLAWAIEANNGEGERWLRSDRKQREQFFTPAKLRKAAAGKFRSQDYGYHCEFGGHPVPASGLLLEGGPEVAQLLLSDLLGHVGRIWDHFVGWARGKSHGSPLLGRTESMSSRFVAWKLADPLAGLPPPP